VAGQEHVTFLCLIYIIFSRYFVFCVDCSDIEKIHPVAGQEHVTFLCLIYIIFSRFFVFCVDQLQQQHCPCLLAASEWCQAVSNSMGCL